MSSTPRVLVHQVSMKSRVQRPFGAQDRRSVQQRIGAKVSFPEQASNLTQRMELNNQRCLNEDKITFNQDLIALDEQVYDIPLMKQRIKRFSDMDTIRYRAHQFEEETANPESDDDINNLFYDVNISNMFVFHKCGRVTFASIYLESFIAHLNIG